MNKKHLVIALYFIAVLNSIMFFTTIISNPLVSIYLGLSAFFYYCFASYLCFKKDRSLKTDESIELLDCHYYVEATSALIVRHKTNGIICETEDEEFSFRIVDCLNACNGMSDPIFEIENLAYRASSYPNRIALETKVETLKIEINTMRYLFEQLNKAITTIDLYNARSRISEYLMVTKNDEYV